MGVYNWSYGSAIATIIAAVITTVAAIWINRQTRKSERIRDGMLIDAEVRNQEFQKTQALLSAPMA